MLAKDALAVVCELRKQRKLTLAEVAKGIGYKSGKGYRDIEIGKTELTLNHIENLANFYEVPFNIFFAPKSSEMDRNVG